MLKKLPRRKEIPAPTRISRRDESLALKATCLFLFPRKGIFNECGEIGRPSRARSRTRHRQGAAGRCPFKYRAYFRRCRCIWPNGSAEISSASISAISISDTHDLFMKKAPRATGGRRGGQNLAGGMREVCNIAYRDPPGAEGARARDSRV